VSAANGHSRVLWWIITGLTAITFGAGSNYVTRLDRLVEVEVQLRELGRKVDRLTTEIEQLRSRR
jgi:hypothetical protein